jgi:2-amino-4-hydroxy-6-hydroxymethyldihydropteridine diphosphokinase/dihydropteroate synthase
MIFLGLGSNLGNRFDNIRKAISLLKKTCLKNIKTSLVLETKAILHCNAPQSYNLPYLNIVISGTTNLTPEGFIIESKKIELQLGRPLGYKKNSPRIIDIDILLWKDKVINTKTLTVPHPEISQRPFLKILINSLKKDYMHSLNIENDSFIKSYVIDPKIIGVLNITQDSFSDGNLYYEPKKALKQIDKLISSGSSIIEIGAQSTRPGASIRVHQEELNLIKNIFDNIKQNLNYNSAIFSIDAFHPEVIEYAIDKYKITWVNDVSGNLDQNTLKNIANNVEKFCIMHSISIPPCRDRIIPLNVNCTDYLLEWSEHKIHELTKLGFNKEQIVIDPGIGFGKNFYQSMDILKNLNKFKSLGVEIMIGHSRKSYITNFANYPSSNRDIETSVISASIANNIDYLRVHNVEQNMRALVTNHTFNN